MHRAQLSLFPPCSLFALSVLPRVSVSALPAVSFELLVWQLGDCREEAIRAILTRLDEADQQTRNDVKQAEQQAKQQE